MNNVLKQAAKEVAKGVSKVNLKENKSSYPKDNDGNMFGEIVKSVAPTILKNLPRKYKFYIAIGVWIAISGVVQNIKWIISLISNI